MMLKENIKEEKKSKNTKAFLSIGSKWNVTIPAIFR